MSVIRVGSSTKYADGWDTVFGGRKTATKKTSAGTKKKTVKKTAKKAAKKAAKARRG